MVSRKSTSGSPEGCKIVLLHSALGLREGVLEWAERLRAAGHAVYCPDLYDGQVFETVEAGVRAKNALGGLTTLKERARAAVQGCPTRVAYAGFSIGAEVAEFLTLTRPGALGAILMHGALPPGELGAEVWPRDAPVQIHYAVGDPFRDQPEIDAVNAAVQRSGAICEIWDYPGSAHLFADPGLPDFHPRSAELMADRVLRFLARIKSPSDARG